MCGCMAGNFWSSATLVWPKISNMRYRWECGEGLCPITPSIKRALSAEVWRRFCGPRVPNMSYRRKCGEVLWPIIPSIKHALSSKFWRRFLRPKSTKKCATVESAAKFCGQQLQVWNRRYRLKFGDAFTAQKYQKMRYRWKCRDVLWPTTPSIEHALSAEVWRRFCGPKVPNMRYRWKCG